jgi:hypothetical protein
LNDLWLLDLSCLYPEEDVIHGKQNDKKKHPPKKKKGFSEVPIWTKLMDNVPIPGRYLHSSFIHFENKNNKFHFQFCVFGGLNGASVGGVDASIWALKVHHDETSNKCDVHEGFKNLLPIERHDDDSGGGGSQNFSSSSSASHGAFLVVGLGDIAPQIDADADATNTTVSLSPRRTSKPNDPQDSFPNALLAFTVNEKNDGNVMMLVIDEDSDVVRTIRAADLAQESVLSSQASAEVDEKADDNKIIRKEYANGDVYEGE